MTSEEITKDIIVAWLSNPAAAGATPWGKDATKTGEFIAAVYRTVFETVEESTRKATEQGRAAHRGS